MPTIEMKLEVRGLKELLSKWQRAPELSERKMGEATRLATEMTRAKIKEFTPVRTGYLRSMILSSFRPGMGVIRSYAKYGVFVHEGTRPHDIFPVRRKALYWKGALHPVRVVHHPGTKGRPFMRLGAEASEQAVSKVFQGAVDGLLKQLT